MLLNNIKAKEPANQIVAMDWGKGVAVVQAAAGGMTVVHFDLRGCRSNKFVMVGTPRAICSIRAGVLQRC